MGVPQHHLVFLVFVAAQLLDGAFSYVGIRQFGITVEQNALLVFYIEAFGLAATLIAAKFLACGCGLVLHLASRHRAIAIAAGAYLGLAIVPWLLVFAAPIV